MKKLANQQENQLKEVNQRAQILLTQQDQLKQSLNAIRQNPAPQAPAIPVNNEIVQEVQKTIEEDEDEVAIQLKNWIESGD